MSFFPADPSLPREVSSHETPAAQSLGGAAVNTSLPASPGTIPTTSSPTTEAAAPSRQTHRPMLDSGDLHRVPSLPSAVPQHPTPGSVRAPFGRTPILSPGVAPTVALTHPEQLITSFASVNATPKSSGAAAAARAGWAAAATAAESLPTDFINDAHHHHQHEPDQDARSDHGLDTDDDLLNVSPTAPFAATHHHVNHQHQRPPSLPPGSARGRGRSDSMQRHLHNPSAGGAGGVHATLRHRTSRNSEATPLVRPTFPSTPSIPPMPTKHHAEPEKLTTTLQETAAASNKPRWYQRIRWGVLALILAAFLIASMSAISVFLIRVGYHPFQVTYNRSFALSIFSIGGLLRARRLPLPLDKQEKPVGAWLAVVDGCLGTFDVMCVFTASQWLPLTEAIVLWSLSPIFATVFSYFIVGDRVSWVHLVGSALFITGAFVASDPVATVSGEGGSETTAWVGRGLALAAAVFRGLRHAVTRRHFTAAHTTHWLTAPFWLGVMGMALCGMTSLVFPFRSEPAPWWIYMLVLAAMACATLQHLFTGFAAQHEDAVVLGVIINLNTVFALFWQAVLFDESPTWYQYVSVVCVVAAAILVGVEKKLVGRFGGCRTHRDRERAASDATRGSSTTYAEIPSSGSPLGNADRDEQEMTATGA